MRVFGRLVNIVWWWKWPRFGIWQYPEFDMREVVPDMPSKYWTGYDFGVVEVRIWWRGW